ncbi:MAG: TIM barrel protein [Dehalococcoidia bacterium]|nr:TIM barrel protein [Dehalococcoidia bacterium]
MSGRAVGFHCNRLSYLDEAITRNGLSRGEFYNFPAGDIAALKRCITTRNLARSIHSPLVKPDWYPDPPTWSFLCDVEETSRSRTFRMIEQTLDHAQDIGAEYVIVHFPTPSTDAQGESEQELLDIAWKSCDQLAELSVKWSVPIHIEGLGNSPHLNDGFLIEVLRQYPLRYCFDTGHMHLASKLRHFDLYEFAGTIAGFVGSMHLWNNRGHHDYLTFRHIAIHPSQLPEEGWVDIKRLLGILQPTCPVIFEYPTFYPEALGHHDYRDGVKWVKELLAISS